MKNGSVKREKSVYSKRRKPASLAVTDIAITFVILVTFSIFVVTTATFSDDLRGDFNSTADFSAESKSLINNNVDQFPSLFDNLVFLAYVLLMVGLVISVFLVDTQPIFLILTIVLIFFSIVALMILSNVYDDLMTDSDLSAFAGRFPKTQWLMTHLVEIAIGAAFMTIISLYAKQRLFA